MPPWDSPAQPPPFLATENPGFLLPEWQKRTTLCLFFPYPVAHFSGGRKSDSKAMILPKPSNLSCGFSFRSSSSNLQRHAPSPTKFLPRISFCRVKLTLRACGGDGKEGGEKQTFLTLEEAGLVEMSGLSTHERFLCRLTISSLNLLRVIAEEEGCSIEELNAGRLCDWFVKDRLKREQNIDSAVLQWDDSELQF